MSQIEKNLLLGLDIGTSSIKLVITDNKNNEIVYELSESTHSARIHTANQLNNEQNVTVILDIVSSLLNQIPIESLMRLKAIQICGQMHGVVLWHSQTGKYSNLVTWQDARCTEKFLSSLPVQSKTDLNTGYGNATLFWYSLNEPSTYFDDYDSCGTIQDFVTFKLSGNCSMSIHNSLSWGYFDFEEYDWQDELRDCKQFPSQILPKILPPGSLVSCSVKLMNNGIYLDKTAIYVALGDLQCTLHSCVDYDYDCVINISTSSQVCISIDSSRFESLKQRLPNSVSPLAYYGNKIFLVSASLNGGNVLDSFIEMLIDWNLQLGFQCDNTKASIWPKLLGLAEEWCNTNQDSRLKCKPLLFGERHAKQIFASIHNITNQSTSLGEIFSSICIGIIENLNEMFPFDLLVNELGCKRLVATGGALLRNKILKRALERHFSKVPIVYKATGDAAKGAAQFIKMFS